MTVKKNIHPAFRIVAGCCIRMMFLALVFNCLSLFTKPVSDNLGFERSAFTIYFSLNSIVGVFAIPLWGKVLPRIGIRFGLLITGFFASVFMAMMALCRSLPSFYIMGFLLGIFSSGGTAFPVSILINAWFKKKNGMVMGIVMAFSGVGGVIFSPIVNNTILKLGWQAGYILCGFLILLITIISVLLIRGTPEKLGLKPYGYDEKEITAGDGSLLSGIMSKTAFRSSSFYYLIIGTFFLNLVIGSMQHLPAHFVGIGIPAETAGSIMSFLSFSLILGKILLEFLNDRFGTVFSLSVTLVPFLLSFLGLILLPSETAAYITVFLYALGIATSTVLPALITAKLFGQKDFQLLYAIITSSITLGLAVGSPLVGLSFDKTGSYNLAFWILAGFTALTLALHILAFKNKHKMYKKQCAVPGCKIYTKTKEETC